MKNAIGGILGVVGGLGLLALVTAFFAFGLFQMFVGYKGIALGLGSGWAWGAVFAAVVLRFTLPITIGAFYGAMHLWGWHWYWAALFAAPGLLYMVPGMVALLVSFLGDKRGYQARGS